ncbi:uncharacterized protein ISCGN_011284 [Ixodes scapularis]
MRSTFGTTSGCLRALSTPCSSWCPIKSENKHLLEENHHARTAANCDTQSSKPAKQRAGGRTGSLNFNYKTTFSKLMLAICNAKYRFLYVEIGHHGSESDAGIFIRSDFLQAIAEGQRRLPTASWLGSRKVPYFFVGDEAFPLKTFVMRPFLRKNLAGRPPRVFNY